MGETPKTFILCPHKGAKNLSNFRCKPVEKQFHKPGHLPFSHRHALKPSVL